MGTIAQQWHSLLGQMGEGQLTKRTLGQWLTSIRIQNLRIEIIFIKVCTVLTLALITYTRDYYF